ncbi:hypothetical protein Tco_1314500 [Tanacetum coccineum]
MAIEMESGYKEVEAENANDGDEVEAEVRVLKVCRFDFGREVSIELLANGEHVRIGSRANLVRDAIMVKIRTNGPF